MLLKVLSKLGRKKTVLDRGPSHPKFSEAKPWLNRYYVLFRNRPRWFPFNIIIHEMLDDDHGEGVHNHLCTYITIIIKEDIGRQRLQENIGDHLATLDLDLQTIFIELI